VIVAQGRTDVVFPSGDTLCAAWLRRPTPPAGGEGRVPIIVLGHGLGCTREMGLDRYASRFAEAGFATLAFDYRHFGASGGVPRQVPDIERQLDDWAAAIAYTRTVHSVDPHRIALWGTSLGGGHVIKVAARDRRVAAVVSQCPVTDGSSSVRALGPHSGLKVAPAILRDQAAAICRTAPVTVKLVGPPGSAALLTTPDAEPGYRALVPASAPIADEVAARIGLHIGRYRPGRAAIKVRCPILFCVCDHDTVAPVGPTLRAMRQAPYGEMRRYPVGHFDIFHGEAFERAVADQIRFLRRHLMPAGAPAGATEEAPAAEEAPVPAR